MLFLFDRKKARKVLSEWNDVEEKLTENEKIKGTCSELLKILIYNFFSNFTIFFSSEKPKEVPVRPRAKKTNKKKDSFIASDASSVENESMSLYHKFIAENIKFDVIKTTTPRSRYK